MDNQNNNRNSFCEKSCPSCPSIFEALESVKEQVEFWCFERTHTNAKGQSWKDTDPLFGELCLIIAEIYVMKPDRAIRIGGAEITVGIVQEVYTKLQHEHLETVAYNFQHITTKVFKKKPYLQTALYNAVFEAESGVVNDIARTMPWMYERGNNNG